MTSTTLEGSDGCFRCGFAIGFVAGMVTLLAITLMAFGIHALFV